MYLDESYKTLEKMFNFLFEQHCKNSTLILTTLALLTDELMKIDKPDFEIHELLLLMNKK